MPAPTALVVDDDESLRRLIQLTLESQGYAVHTAADGDCALELAGRHCPEWVFLDWQMPGLSGVDVCRALRASGSTATVVMLSGRAAEEDRSAALAAGASEFLVKPVLPADLLCSISELSDADHRADAHRG